MKTRRFPVLLSQADRKEFDDCPESILWADIEPHTWQAYKNHGQSLARLADRGGLGPDELVAVFERRTWHSMPMREAIDRLKQLLGWTEGNIERENKRGCSCGSVGSFGCASPYCEYKTKE